MLISLNSELWMPLSTDTPKKLNGLHKIYSINKVKVSYLNLCKFFLEMKYVSNTEYVICSKQNECYSQFQSN